MGDHASLVVGSSAGTIPRRALRIFCIWYLVFFYVEPPAGAHAVRCRASSSARCSTSLRVVAAASSAASAARCASASAAARAGLGTHRSAAAAAGGGSSAAGVSGSGASSARGAPPSYARRGDAMNASW